MAENPKPEPDDKEQSDRFIETARQLEADESGKAFDNVIKTLLNTTQEPIKTTDE